MGPLCYSGYRFPSDVIQRAVWMYLRFTLSYRNVEDLLAERGMGLSRSDNSHRFPPSGRPCLHP